MKFAREVSGISHGVSLGLLAALYVRDSLALSVDVEPHVPGLDPPLPVRVPTGVDRVAVTAEWPGWWADALDACTHDAESVTAENAAALLTRPASRAAVLALKPGIEQLHRVQSPAPLPIGDVLRGVESRIGRWAQSVELHIAEVPVEGLLWERIAPAHVLASTRFLNDPARTAPALRAVLEDLV
ncbi:hypothetical protein V1227_28970 [Lentzea sp. DG1S-22]|uniref:hypothetical protein n=1 Tax=Lentzea sp. DG1S-22 TaxID=3108822 RepID=UPI002E775C69|nr:hypothetical protein [Lentzea sp. DG1S-22]WVH79052.1 hypothetical protein V1227_28970 [Lentzea sp. DG1S-22]